MTFANPDIAESVLYANNPCGHVIDGKKVLACVCVCVCAA